MIAGVAVGILVWPTAKIKRALFPTFSPHKSKDAEQPKTNKEKGSRFGNDIRERQVTGNARKTTGGENE